ncbi:MAG: hypothetical protein FJ039_09060 [Chloroflexi bacterium]|nr:hypothetical protein [Chloroflexota bacterium]
MTTEKLGEVVEASTASFTVHCHKLGEPPPLGSLVIVADGDLLIFGVVHNAATAGIDPSRKALALGEELASADDVYKEHPELTKLLRTDFTALVVGYRDKNGVRHTLPPRPAKIHGFAHVAAKQETQDFTAVFHFLDALLNSEAENRDAALAACLRLASTAHNEKDYLVRAGKELARLLAQDSRRLNTILRMLKG